MPGRTLEKIRPVDGQSWEVLETKTGPARRGAFPSPEDRFLNQILASKRLAVVDRKQARSLPRRGLAGTLSLEMEAQPGAAYVLMARHESGAITFHLPAQVEHRAIRGVTSRTIRFSIPLSEGSAQEQARRGIFGKVVNTVVLKVAGAIAGKAMPVLARLFETAVWKLKGLQEGWKQVSAAALQAKSLPKVNIAKAVSSDPAQRNLLLIHGTFSNAASAFAGLATARGASGKTFFQSLQQIYGDRIFAFDHFTVSRSPSDNCKALLEELPNRPCLFDVVTHSRGGLVLRTLVEEAGSLGPAASRFNLGRAVLVASPNGGTPLATPSRFNHFLDWTSNLLDLFPENPFTVGAEFVSEGLAWLAHGVGVDLPGLASMNSDGPVIQQLQAAPGPPAKAYSALVANYEPDQGLLQRMVDAGVDVFFGTANDLVVPTEGGWLVDPGGTPVIPGDQIGSFGRGGNLQNPPDGQVNHVSFFSRSATVDFLGRGLQGKPQGLSLLDPGTQLPFRSRRGAMAAVAGITGKARSTALPTPPVVSPALVPAKPSFGGRSEGEVFYLSVLGSDEKFGVATLMATFRNARVMETMPTSGGEAGKRFQNIIQKQRDMRRFLNGEPGAKELPRDDSLIKLGEDLFETLFPGQVRRLYDLARASQPDGRLDLIFTSMISWIADLPWEFAYDTGREHFLATSEVNFTRNVRTAIPADRIQERDPLRILVVVAQPLGLAHLSVDEETEVIKSGFKRLIDDGLAEVDVLLDATPPLLHQTLEVSESYDILHFIGHGEYDSETKLGYLAFENENEGLQKVDSDVLQQIVCRRGVRLMFLNACESGKGGTADFNRGVAPALVAGGVPAVVANQFSVLDVSATAFARHFYWALAQGRTIGDAAREARVAVNYSISGEAIDWAVPVVFARNPADRLTTVKQAAARQVAEVQNSRLAARRSLRAALPEAESRSKIGLWDVQRIIPHLDLIATAFTNAQANYVFKAVSIPAPLGTWRPEKTGGISYLHAERVVQRLSDKPREFGVDRLIAITNLPLRDNDTLGLYAWEDSKGEISLFSTYGLLDQIKPPLTIERMVANAVAAFVGGLKEHKTGRKNCPFYYNEKLEIQYVAGALEVCVPCRQKLRKDSERLQAVERLLKAYP